MSDSRCALVFGGTGHVGREIVRELTRAGQRVVFTYHQHAEFAATLGAETGAKGYATNLAEPNPIRVFFQQLEHDAVAPDILIHAAVLACRSSVGAISDELADSMYAVNVRSLLVAMPLFVARLGGRPADVIVTASQAGITKLPASAAFAATQSARLGMTHALAKELGDQGVRINVALLGLLDGGISAGIDPERLADYQRFSAFSRVGTSVEVAKAIVRLALTNRWMTGSVLSVTGGL